MAALESPVRLLLWRQEARGVFVVTAEHQPLSSSSPETMCCSPTANTAEPSTNWNISFISVFHSTLAHSITLWLTSYHTRVR